MSQEYEVCALLSKTHRIKPLYPKDVIRLRAEELASANWNGLRSTRFHVEKRTPLGWVTWSNPISQGDMMRIMYVVDEATTEQAGPKDEATCARIQRMICLPKGMRLKESKFDGPWDLPELDGPECGKVPVLFVRETED